MKSKLDFKLNYYFNKYKDHPIANVSDFRKKFKRENGDFQYLSELIVMISKYQVKKYGETIPNGKIFYVRNLEERRKINNKISMLERYRRNK